MGEHCRIWILVRKSMRLSCPLRKESGAMEYCIYISLRATAGFPLLIQLARCCSLASADGNLHRGAFKSQPCVAFDPLSAAFAGKSTVVITNTCDTVVARTMLIGIGWHGLPADFRVVARVFFCFVLFVCVLLVQSHHAVACCVCRWCLCQAQLAISFRCWNQELNRDLKIRRLICTAKRM